MDTKVALLIPALSATNSDVNLLLVAKDDELGRKLQDLDLPVRKRAPRRG